MPNFWSNIQGQSVTVLAVDDDPGKGSLLNVTLSRTVAYTTSNAAEMQLLRNDFKTVAYENATAPTPT